MVNTDIDERRQKILWTVVKEYIEEAQPVGSSIIQKKYHLDVSPATIRNEMAHLEKAGYLTHPHTSAGRIPTDKGYRFYVDNLMNIYKLTAKERDLIKQAYLAQGKNVENIMENTLHLLLSVSNYFSVVTEKSTLLQEKLGKAKRALPRARSEKIYYSGLSKLLNEPEFENTKHIRSLVGIFEDDSRARSLFKDEQDTDELVIRIGEENICDELKDYSFITKKFHCGESPAGTIGIIGPKRMRYSQVASAISQITENLDNALNYL